MINPILNLMGNNVVSHTFPTTTGVDCRSVVVNGEVCERIIQAVCKPLPLECDRLPSIPFFVLKFLIFILVFAAAAAAATGA
jgi:hypothetical protein